MSADNVIRIKPLFYIHVLDNNTNVTRLIVGPKTYTRQDHEQVVSGPNQMVLLPPRHYIVISNPVARDAKGEVVFETDSEGKATLSAKLRFGDEEIRFNNEPFPLYPGEAPVGKPTPLQVVPAQAALRLRAVRDFKDGEVDRKAGDEWLFNGPSTYIPRVEVQVVELIKATIIKQNTAIKLRARRALVDQEGVSRKAGDQWLVSKVGAFLPGVDEEIVQTVNAFVLTDKKALQLRALSTFTDKFGKQRKAGEEWLVTFRDTETHIPDVFEEVVGDVNITTLNNRQWAVVLDPIGADGKPQLGKRELRKGEVSFFLQPGEKLEAGIQNVHVLGAEEALLLRAREAFKDESVERRPGDRWLCKGPRDYIPPVQVQVVEKRKVTPLDENEGIYVRDTRSGRVRSVTGESYMLTENEELWEKILPEEVESLLSQAPRGIKTGTPSQRDKSRVVTYRCPHNSAVQVYDYKKKEARVVFGPDLVMLSPDEQFTILNLSGGKPKQEGAIKSLALQLGPDFMTDIVTVETSDHARLSLQLAYNWFFDIKHGDANDAPKLFQVPDFVGAACKAIASRVRGAVAAASFDDFHRHSAEIIRVAVFGKESDGKTRAQLRFKSNSLVITNIDIQSVEPIDQRTRDSLQKSVQLAIEITTKSQEATARQKAEREEQKARGLLERQKILDEAEAERTRIELVRLQAASAAVESSGQAAAEARAKADAALIEAEAAVKQSELLANATKIRLGAELEQLTNRQKAEIEHKRAVIDLELHKAQELADIESKKFKEIVDAIGANTIKAMAQAGPEMQVKLLQSLGLKSFMITDGHSPINLFNTASGLIAGGMEQ